MVDVGPAGYLRFTGDLTPEQEAQMREHFRRATGSPVLLVGPGVEYTRTRPRRGMPPGRVPDAQAAFTLRSVLAAHQAAVQNLDRLRAQRAAPVDDSPGAMLAAAARAEQRARDLEAAEAREAEVREELAQAHARATGRPLPTPAVPAHAYGPGSLPRTVDPKRVAEQELADARQAEAQARHRLTALGNGPGQLQRAHARHLRKQAGWVLWFGIGGASTVATGFPTIVPVVAFTLMCAVIVLGLYGITESRRRIAEVAAKVPDASADHDVALRRLVGAEAAAVAAGLDVTPSTLDADVEAVAAAPVPLAWEG